MVYTGTKNDLSTRTEPCVALRDSNNSGGHYFMSLKTERRIHVNKLTEVPTSQEIIDRVHCLAQGSKQQWHNMESLIFESDPGTPILDNAPIYNDVTYHDEVINDGHIEINNRVAAAAENINDNESVGETQEEESVVDSNSTFIPNEDQTDDEVYQPDISEVDSQDFEFNLANVHEINSDVSSRSTDTSSLDTCVTKSEVIDLTQDSTIPHTADSTEAQDSFQLMNHIKHPGPFKLINLFHKSSTKVYTSTDSNNKRQI